MSVRQVEMANHSQECDREKQAIEHTKNLIKDKTNEVGRLDSSIVDLCYDEEELPRLEKKVEDIKAEMVAKMPRPPQMIQDEIDNKKRLEKRQIEKRNQFKEQLK